VHEPHQPRRALRKKETGDGKASAAGDELNPPGAMDAEAEREADPDKDSEDTQAEVV
jgi:hypothetical protein